MIRYVLYGSVSCLKCKVAEQKLEALKIEFLYRDIGDADYLADYRLLISECNGDGGKRPGLLACEVGGESGSEELLKKLYQGDAAIDYLKELEKAAKEKKYTGGY